MALLGQTKAYRRYHVFTQSLSLIKNHRYSPHANGLQLPAAYGKLFTESNPYLIGALMIYRFCRLIGCDSLSTGLSWEFGTDPSLITDVWVGI